MAFISANLSTILISLVLLVIFTLIIVNMVRKKKKGESGCSCGCSNCALSGTCHKTDAQPSENK